MTVSFWRRSGRYGLIGLGIGLVIFGLFLGLKDSSSPDVEFFSTQEEVKPELVVDISGAVNRPGVYRLKQGFRLGQAIEAAGGLTDQADLDWVERTLNLARTVNDGEKIYIPAKGEEAGRVAGAKTDLINLNRASLSELESLSGIGPSFAQKIIDYRQAQGGFKSIEEIMAVPGIGRKTFERIKDKITI